MTDQKEVNKRIMLTLYCLAFGTGLAAMTLVSYIVGYFAVTLPVYGGSAAKLDYYLSFVTVLATLIVYGGGIILFNVVAGKFLKIKLNLLMPFLVTSLFGIIAGILLFIFGIYLYSSPNLAIVTSIIHTMIMGGAYVLGVHVGLALPNPSNTNLRGKNHD